MTGITCSAKSFCVGGLLIFVGSVLLCAMGFTVVLPHNITASWPLITCNVTNATYNKSTCTCGKAENLVDNDCHKYPCLQIHVSYRVPENLTEKAGVEHRIGVLYRQWSDAFYETCSVLECAEAEWNVRETQRFQKDRGQVGQQYPCYLDPTNPYRTVLNRPSVSAVVHAVFWPCLLLTCGSLVWLGLCMGCWQVADKDEQLPQSSRSLI